MRICIALLSGCAVSSHVVVHDDRTDDSARIDDIIDSTRPSIAVAMLDSTNEQRIDFDMKAEVFGPETPGAEGIALAWDADPLAPQPPALAFATRPVPLASRLRNTPLGIGGVTASAPPTSPASGPPPSTPIGPHAATPAAPRGPSVHSAHAVHH